MSEHKLAWCEKDGRQYFFLNGMPLFDLPTPAHKFGNTIETIKAIRAVTGCALKDAKDIWDQRTRLHVAPNPTTCPDCAAKDALLERARAVIGNLLPTMQICTCDECALITGAAAELLAELNK